MPARSRRTPTEHKPLTPARPPLYCSTQAPVAELVDAPDSKSGGGNIVLVRVRPGAPNLHITNREACAPRQGQSVTFKRLNRKSVPAKFAPARDKTAGTFPIEIRRLPATRFRQPPL